MHLFLTVYLEIEGLWYYHIYCKWWIKSVYLSNSKLIDCLKGGLSLSTSVISKKNYLLFNIS